MSNALSTQRLINVSVLLAPGAAVAQDINTILVAGTSDVIDITERKRTYQDVDTIALQFGTNSEEYLEAIKAFAQTPQPANIIIAKWAKTATAGRLTGRPLTAAEQLIATWQAITSSKFKVSIDGGAQTDVTIGSFAAVSNLNGVAAVIQTGLNSLVAGTTCTWDSVNQLFVIKSGSTGTSSSVSFLSAPSTGTDISNMLGMRSTSSGAYLTSGVAAESLLDATVELDDRFGQEWYGMIAPSATVTDHIDTAQFLESTTNKHTYWVTTIDTAVLSSVSTTDLAYVLKNLNLNRTILQYSSTSPHAVAALASKALSVNYNGNKTVIDLMYKQEQTLTPERLSSTQASVLRSKNANAFLAYNNNTAIVERGDTTSGVPIDIITGTDWLSLTIGVALYNKLYQSTTKIPQTDDGNHELKTAIDSVLAQAVSNGLIAPGVWNSGGFGALKNGDYMPSGYYVYAPPIDTQLQSDREQRKSVLFQIAVKLAGSIRTVDVQINVNR